MSDDKKYSAKQVAEMVLKKAYDMAKNMNKAKMHPKKEPKEEPYEERGVNIPSGPYGAPSKRNVGQSRMGDSVRESKAYKDQHRKMPLTQKIKLIPSNLEGLSTPKNMSRVYRDKARDEAKRTLSTLKQMPKPDLPKSEMEKCGEMTVKKTKKLKEFAEKVKQKREKK